MNAKEKTKNLLKLKGSPKEKAYTHLEEQDWYENGYSKVCYEAIDIAIKEAKKEVFDDIENKFNIQFGLGKEDWLKLKKKHLEDK